MSTSYTLRFSDPANIDTITVLGTTIGTGKNNYDTSLDLVGPGYVNYGQDTAQNFLKLLENFAGPNPPANSIQGQLWFDTSNPNRGVLRVNNGSVTSNRWPAASGIYQQSSDPARSYSTSVTVGDIWVDTRSNQLNIRASDRWVIVGPTVETGTGKSGPEAVGLTSNTGTTSTVILNWVNGKVVEIISSTDFTPRTVIDGFTTIKAGTNLTSRIPARYNGIAESALALYLSPGVTIKATDVLKNKSPTIPQIHTGTFVVDAVDGLWVKAEGSSDRVQISKSSSAASVFYTKTVGSSMRIGIGNGTTDNPTFLKFVANSKNVGVNNSDPQSTLDVTGDGQFSDTLAVGSTSTSALTVAGGATFGKTVAVNGLTVTNITTLSGGLVLGEIGTSEIAIRPTASDEYDIGSETAAFRRIYVSQIGSPAGGEITIYGSVSTATHLRDPQNFSINGQLTTTAFVSFDGSDDVVMTTVATERIITEQPVTSSTASTLTLLVVDTSTSASVTGPQQISKKDFLSDVYEIGFQPGMITPCGTSTMVGFLLCDGNLYNRVDHLDLYNVIGESYGTSSPGSTFRVPNMTNITTATGGYAIYYLIKR